MVFGTRPEAIKMAPVVKALEHRKDFFELVTCVTGQHRQMLDQVLSIFEITPDIDLALMEPNQTLVSLTARALTSISDVIAREKPDVILVQGDTTTAMVAGLAGFYAKVPVGHVEAGLRTAERYDPFPEEINRRLLSQLATFHFAPTETSVNWLLGEGFAKEDIYRTGNTVIDALLMVASMGRGAHAAVDLVSERYILVTAHRRENFGGPIREICGALKKIVEQNRNVDIVYPVHLNPNIYEPVHSELAGCERIHLIPPLEYEEFVYMMKGAHLILTDSGGVQEEAPSFGKPVLVMRETTERPEAVSAGVAKLVGTDGDNIVSQVRELLVDGDAYEKMAQARNPFGDGNSAETIVNILTERLFD